MPKNTGKHPRNREVGLADRMAALMEKGADRERAEWWYAHQDPWDKEGMRRAREALWSGRPLPMPVAEKPYPWPPAWWKEPPAPKLLVAPLRHNRPPSQRALAEAYRMDRALSVRRPRAKRVEGWGMARRQARWMDADPCVYCGGPADSYDHIEPRKRGGTNGQDNLAHVCHSCNHEKTSRTLLVFLTVRAQRKAAGTYKRLPNLKLRRAEKQCDALVS